MQRGTGGPPQGLTSFGAELVGLLDENLLFFALFTDSIKLIISTII